MGYITKDQYNENVLVLPHKSSEYWSVSTDSEHNIYIRGEVIDKIAEYEEEKKNPDSLHFSFKVSEEENVKIATSIVRVLLLAEAVEYKPGGKNADPELYVDMKYDEKFGQAFDIVMTAIINGYELKK